MLSTISDDFRLLIGFFLLEYYRSWSSDFCPLPIFVAIHAKLGLNFRLKNGALDIYSRIRRSSGTEKLQGKYKNTNPIKLLTYGAHHPQRFNVPLLCCEFFKRRKPQKIAKASRRSEAWPGF